MAKKLTTEEFIIKAKAIHGDRYDYSLVEYINVHTFIKIKCKEHGIFEQYPNNHLAGSGCSICSKNKKLTTEEFIQRSKDIHDDIYDYSLVKYIKSSIKVKIICKIHGIFEQKANNHLNGKGCQKCGIRMKSNVQTRTLDCFIINSNIIHNGKYDYSKTEYFLANDKVIIICPIHGEFKQKAQYHLNGGNCPKCSNSSFSQIAIEWLEYIVKEENIYIQHAGNDIEYKILETIIDGNNRTGIKVDGYCKETNTIYEFLGDYWHGNPKKFLIEDINPNTKKSFGECYIDTINRLELIKSLGYNIIYIWESDWRNYNV